MNEITEKFGNRLRLRACGILIEDNCLLLIKHLSLGKSGELWAPPGGGLNYGESLENCLKREFKEETGLDISVGNLLFANEYLQPPLHAVELFYEVRRTGGELCQGIDPELGIDQQIIQEVRFISLDELKTIPEDSLHGRLHGLENWSELTLQKN